MIKFKRISDALLAYALAVVLLIVFNFLITPSLGLWGSALCELMILAVAVGAVKLRKENIKERFCIEVVPAKSIFGGILLAFAATTLSDAVLTVMQCYFPDSAQIDSNVDKLIESYPTFLLLLVLVVLPAVCEELFFRGFFQNSLSSIKPIVAIPIVGILFGAIHFQPYKIVPAAVIGAGFAFVTYLSGSVLPAVICHLLHNASSLVTRSQLNNIGDGEQYEYLFSNASCWLIALATIGIGFIIGYLGYKLMTGKRFKRPFGVLSVILAIIVTGGALLAVTGIETDVNIESNLRTIDYEYKFTLDTPRMCIINVVGYGDANAPVTISLYDENGDIVEKATESLSVYGVIEKGTYTVTANADKEGEGERLNVLVCLGPKVKKLTQNNESSE